ncbi:MAG: alanine--tRNA ligase, partial [Chlamydiae bacterium]|nr:alanine--tRNA ligase [Chlamydiota bacterium]
VRVVDLEASKELCGGTHTSRTGTIGLFKIAKESSIAAGVRRIEAITGYVAEEEIRREEKKLKAMAQLLKATSGNLVEKLKLLLEENKALTLQIKQLRKGHIKQIIESCLASKQMVHSIAFVAEEIDIPADELNSCVEEILSQLKSGVVALGTKTGDRCQIAIAVSDDLVKKNIHAQVLIKEISPLIQGGGGGKQHLAQAGGKDGAAIGKALDKIRHLLEGVSVV